LRPTADGFVSFFDNFIRIAILLIAWLIVALSFFIMATQFFISLIEFKLSSPTRPRGPHLDLSSTKDAKIYAMGMLGPSICSQRRQFASSSIRQLL
jgi:hypothetical protein